MKALKHSDLKAWDVAEHLKTHESQAAYLQAALEDAPETLSLLLVFWVTLRARVAWPKLLRKPSCRAKACTSPYLEIVILILVLF